VTFVYERDAGRAVAIVDEVTGPETGPVCSLDKRYVDEQPKGLRPDVLDAWHPLRAKAEEQGLRLCLRACLRRFDAPA
jgi:hypothetical protein